MSILISPMVVPLIISGSALFSLAKIGLSSSMLGIIISHIILGTPFVVITVTATLSSFDHSLTRAASSLGSSPMYTFFKVILPLITPGVISGALFAFVTSFDEVVVVLFLAMARSNNCSNTDVDWFTRTISPTILSVATCLIAGSIIILVLMEILKKI